MNFTTESAAAEARAQSMVKAYDSTPPVPVGAKICSALAAEKTAMCADIVSGLRTVLELSERSIMEASNRPAQPHLGAFHLGHLQRLAIRAASLLERELCEFEERLSAGEAH